MNKVSEELTKKFAKNKYPMSTGSDEWRNLKGDYEVIDDGIAGAIAGEDYNKNLGGERLKELKLVLEKFKSRLDNYQPKDNVEKEEKGIISEKVVIGLEIYNITQGRV